MIKQKINSILLKIQENKINKIQSIINKPLKSFDDAIFRVKTLISIWRLNDAEAILNSLLSVENFNYEKIINNVDISDAKKIILKNDYDKNIFRIKNLNSLIKSKKMGVSFNDFDELNYSDMINVIYRKIKESNFVDAKNFLDKIINNEINSYNSFIFKKNIWIIKKTFYKIKFSKKILFLYDLDISIFYDEIFKWLYSSNKKSLSKLFKNLIKQKEFSLIEQNLQFIYEFENKKLDEILKNNFILPYYKIKFKNRNKSIINLLKNIDSILYKEKTWTSIKISSVKNVKDAFIIINDLSKSYNFDKALLLLQELKNKETLSFDSLISETNMSEKEKEKMIKKFKKFELSLINLENKINADKNIYEFKAHIKDLAVKNNQISKQIDILITQKNFDEAIDILDTYKQSLWNDIDKYAIFCEKYKYKILKSKQKNIWNKKKKQNLLEQVNDIMWDNIETDSYNPELEKEITNPITLFFKNYYNRYKVINKARHDKLLLDNIDSLLNSSNKIKEDVIKSKLEKVHSGLVKDTEGIFIDGYSLYWKTLWADRISWDTFGFYDYNEWKRFFIWDATWHWIKAWFMISLLTQNFHSIVNSIQYLKDLVVTLNNKLKQDLSSWNFITSIFFELIYKDKDNLKFIWMWHEPMFFYKKSDLSVDKIYPGWIAAWMTNLKDQAFLKEKTIHFDIGDILLLYTDGLVEARNENWDMFSIDRIKDTFLKAATLYSEPKEIYNYIYSELSSFVNKTRFYDDVTIIIIKRDVKKDSLNEDKIIADILKTENISKKYIKVLKWKSKDQIESFLKLKRKERELTSILKNLKSIYKTWDLLALKKETQRYIREWFIHKDIVKYLQYSIENESFVKIEQQNLRLQNKYDTLVKLLKAWQYNTVLEEASNIIMNEWKI